MIPPLRVCAQAQAMLKTNVRLGLRRRTMLRILTAHGSGNRPLCVIALRGGILLCSPLYLPYMLGVVGVTWLPLARRLHVPA